MILSVLLTAGIPYLASAQTSDSTHTNPDSAASAAPRSGWKTYRGESGSNQYRYSDMSSGSDFKQHLMVGGALSLGYASGEFLVGANPYVAYALKPWVDAGIVANIQYYSENNTATYGNGTYHNTLLGAGAFARVYPLSFLFLQVQPEENKVWQKESLDGQTTGSLSYSVFDFLVGAGLKFGPQGSNSWGFISLLFDVSGSTLSPYNGPGGNIEPILRAGYNIGL
jgi:hypothetical protein